MAKTPEKDALSVFRTETFSHTEPLAEKTITPTEAEELSRRIGDLLGSINKTLDPTRLATLERKDIQQCVLALEEIKMLLARLEILRLTE